MKIGRWSTVAGNNNSAPPDGYPEGQTPSSVNDCARENMAAIKTALQDIDFFDHDFTPTFVTANSFTVTGNQTARLNAGRKLKLFDVTTIYRAVQTASFTAVTTIQLEAGTAITSSLSSFAIGIINPANNATPNTFDRISVSAIEVTGTLSASSAAVGGALSVGGAVTLGTTLSVSGAAAFIGAVRFDAGVSISATATIGTLQAKNSSITCVAAGGFICTGDITAFSDETMKMNWQPVIPDFIERLANVKSGTYERVDTGRTQAGISAQDLKEVLPEAVHGGGDKLHSVAYGNAAMVAVVELAKEVLRLRELLKKVLP